MTPNRGLWITDRPSRVLTDTYIDRLVEAGYKTAAIMIETSDVAFDPTWTTEQARIATEVLVSRDVEVVLTVWPVPSKAYLDAMFEWLLRAGMSGISGIEVDLEALWRPDRLSGFMHIPQAASYLIGRLHALRSIYDIRIEATTHPWHAESSTLAMVTPYVDRLVIQAYSIRRRPDGRYIAWNDEQLGPGHHQRWAIADAMTVPGVIDGRPQLSVGLAAWSQTWPGHTRNEAMDRAYNAAIECNPPEIRWWSSHHIFPQVA